MTDLRPCKRRFHQPTNQHTKSCPQWMIQAGGSPKPSCLAITSIILMTDSESEPTKSPYASSGFGGKYFLLPFIALRNVLLASAMLLSPAESENNCLLIFFAFCKRTRRMPNLGLKRLHFGRPTGPEASLLITV